MLKEILSGLDLRGDPVRHSRTISSEAHIHTQKLIIIIIIITIAYHCSIKTNEEIESRFLPSF
jgi:hypothetical protein